MNFLRRFTKNREFFKNLTKNSQKFSKTSLYLADNTKNSRPFATKFTPFTFKDQKIRQIQSNFLNLREFFK
ncbi:hypothetical protein DMC01_02110 [Campylobacter troglodytis]|nr:hypothetical protein DMC01_02110 [Campylobacter troglodytis]